MPFQPYRYARNATEGVPYRVPEKKTYGLSSVGFFRSLRQLERLSELTSPEEIAVALGGVVLLK